MRTTIPMTTPSPNSLTRPVVSVTTSGAASVGIGTIGVTSAANPTDSSARTCMGTDMPPIMG
jgi:hypothetical protein